MFLPAFLLLPSSGTRRNARGYTLWTFDGDKVPLPAIGQTGEIIDDAIVTDGRTP